MVVFKFLAENQLYTRVCSVKKKRKRKNLTIWVYPHNHMQWTLQRRKVPELTICRGRRLNLDLAPSEKKHPGRHWFSRRVPGFVEEIRSAFSVFTATFSVLFSEARADVFPLSANSLVRPIFPFSLTFESFSILLDFPQMIYIARLNQNISLAH